MLQVSLRDFKSLMTNAKTAIKAEPMESTAFIQLRLTRTKLWVGGSSASMSYNEAIPYEGDEDFRIVYVPVGAADFLPKNTKDDILELHVKGNDLLFATQDESGVVMFFKDMFLSEPFTDLSEVEPYMVLSSGKFLQNATKLIATVKKGWKVSNKPYAASYARLAAYEEELFREEEDDILPEVCRLLLDDVTYDQARASTFLSSLALSLFATDGSRYFQAFDPTVVAASHDFNSDLVVSTLADAKWIGQPLHLALADLEKFVKLLNDKEYRVGLTRSDGRAVALVFFNKDSILWLRLALDAYPDTDFNRQLALLHGDVVASFTPTKEFINSVTAAEKLEATRKNGLTVRVGSGKVYIASPENAAVTRFDEIDADTHHDVMCVVDGTAFLSAVKTDNELTLVAGDEFLAIYNPVERHRVILRYFTR